MRAAAVACLAALVIPVAGFAAPAPSGAREQARKPLETEVALPNSPARLTEKRATALFLNDDKVRDWLSRYPPAPVTEATFDKRSRAWTVNVWSGEAGEVATGRVDDRTGAVIEAWTGPQVAWTMARGGPDGVFGGPKLNSPWLWLGFCAVFLLGLGDLRRPLSLRNLDLVVLLSFSVSLWFFNRGDIFTSMPLAYPPLAYLLARMVWTGTRGRAGASRTVPVWPVWLIAATAVFLAGFRVGLNVRDSSVIDVGYAGVIGADRIAHGEAPYGHMPVEEGRKRCGAPDAEGKFHARIQTNGRCETANERGDTYGPVSYLAYLPGWAIFGWSGESVDLPAAHFTSIVFDLACLAGLALVGRRFGGSRLAATLALAWAAYPFTQYASSANTNDTIFPAILIFGFLLASSPWARGAAVALAGWTKFAPLLLAPLWFSYGWSLRDAPRRAGAFVAAFALATLAAFSVLLLEPNVLHAVGVFWDRTIGWQLGRESPFSIWDWGQYRAGLPDLHIVQRVLQVLLVIGAVAVAFVPRRKSPLQLAALSAALLIGFELVLTHWFFLYLPWFFPFVAFALLAPPPPEARRDSRPHREHEIRELVAAG
ncbi:MAG: hypothetical protein M3M94_02635 [Actinomycetota bacterium]|nr:hypothetical protein [Actinomycetota bacterium]